MAEKKTISTVHIESEDYDIVDTRSGYQTAEQVSEAITSAIGDAIGAKY